MSSYQLWCQNLWLWTVALHMCYRRLTLSLTTVNTWIFVDSRDQMHLLFVYLNSNIWISLAVFISIFWTLLPIFGIFKKPKSFINAAFVALEILSNNNNKHPPPKKKSPLWIRLRMLNVDKTFFFGVLLITYSGNNDKHLYTITMRTEQCRKLHHSDN